MNRVGSRIDKSRDIIMRKNLYFNLLLVLTIGLLLLAGCAPKQVELPVNVSRTEEVKSKQHDEVKKESFRSRGGISAKKIRYEGSLWEDEASWGNLLRDHRARFRGDLVKIVNLQEVISVSKPKEPKPVAPQTGLAAAGEAAAGQINEAIDAVSLISKAEEEQNEVLASLRQISARVESVLPNGNMVLVGEKVDYRQQNRVRYVTTVRGIIRPADVNENNEVPAVKLARFEPKIKRQMLAKNMNLLAPVVGRQKAGLLDRLSHVVAPSGKTAAPRPVNSN